MTETIIATLVGGAIAIAGGLLASWWADRSERRRRHEDLQVKISADVLSALQTVNRSLMQAAFSGLPRRTEGLADNEQHRQVRAQLESAMDDWYSATSSALVGAGKKVANKIRDLDEEINTLTDAAHRELLSREEFREKRKKLGRAGARYVDSAREELGLAELRLVSIWTWDSDLADT